MTLSWRLVWVGIALFGAYSILDWTLQATGDECERLYAEDRSALVLGLVLLGAAVGAGLLSRYGRMNLAPAWQQAAYLTAVLAGVGICVLLLASAEIDVPLIEKPGFLGQSIGCGL